MKIIRDILFKTPTATWILIAILMGISYSIGVLRKGNYVRSSGLTLPVTFTERFVKRVGNDTYVLFNVKIDGSYFKKNVRAIKGNFVYTDLFDKFIMDTKSNIEESFTKDNPIVSTSIGFKQGSIDSPKKVVEVTVLKYMKIYYKVKTVIYEDGTAEEF